MTRDQRFLVVGVALAVLTPVLLDVVLFADHAAGYRGVCGPYAPDIPEHPCPRDVYLQNFFRPFAVAGLVVADIVVALGTAATVFGIWVVARVLGPRQARGPGPRGG